MKAIKSLVLFLGILLLAGLGLMGYGLYTKKGHVGKPQVSASTVSGDDFGAVSVPLPAGTRIEQMVTAGERVVLRLSGTGGERLLVLDPQSGRMAGSFILSPEAPEARR